MDNWQGQSACALGRGIGAGDIDPVDLVHAVFDAIDAHPHAARIYVRQTRDRALAEAEAARARAKNGVRRGLLDGVPISWKDLFDSAGVATEAGSQLLAGRVPARDAEALARATNAGLVCLGKTHLSELAFSGLGMNPAYGNMTDPLPGTPPNIHDPDWVPGGSSSGAAASVAQGLAAAGIGSDTGGSIRIPAAFNDLVGFKPGYGRISTRGAVPLCERFDTVGPLCRTVEDAAHLVAAMGGDPAPDLAGADLTGRHLAILSPYTEDAEPAPKAAFEGACDRLAAAGARITPFASDAPAEAIRLAAALIPGEAYGIWRDVIEAAPDRIYARIRDRFRAGADVSAPDYVAAWRRLMEVRAGWLAETAAFDAVILPTVACLPAGIDRLMADEDYYVDRNLLTLRNTRIGNLLDLCSLTLPTGSPATGLMFFAPPGQEGRLLRLGRAAEIALT